MEGIRETATVASATSGSEMLKAVASTTLGILLAKGVLKMSCALAGQAAKLVPKRIFQRTVPVHAAATTGAENNVELEEHDEGTAPSKAQVEDV